MTGQPEDPAADAIQSFEQMAGMIGKAQQMMLEFWAKSGGHLSGKASPDSEAASLADLWGDMAGNWARTWATADTAALARLTGDYWADSMRLWTGVLTGKADLVPDPAKRADRRFQGEAWGAAPVYDLIRRSYLLASHYLAEGVASFAHLPEEERRKMEFMAKQFIDAMSPANFAALNPEVLAEAKATGGESLVRGLSHMLDDLKRGQLTMTDEKAFEVGRNVAVTPGKVVFENRLFQLIHYQPTTKTVAEIPLLVIPPFINKFYILDLTPEKSFIRWAVDQGLSVFVVSWAQGSEALADVDLDAYITEGQLTAIDKVREATGAPAAHVIGYCVSGTLLAITLALLAARGEAEKVRSATFFTAQVDFTDAGDLKHFVDPAMLDAIDRMAAEKGYLDGRWLATTFNLLRPTDLMWNYVVNNYLKGKEYAPFDLLYWNSDPTHVPGRFLSTYLRDFYGANRLVQPGAVTVDGAPIDLGRIKTPAYVQAGKDDHIAPASSCLRLAHTLSGPVRFMLAGSGHIAGVVNPPASGKYQHWTLPEGAALPETLDAFRAAATETKGSWWPDWIAWLKPQSGDTVKARVPGKARGFPAIEDAPGRYVRERIS
ncbi:PHA/PHB synthase family protein [Sandaracinobacteroides sp. A072]|uniref:PHA/PHB synthase family protein n=1 Tax=Sandaracinobacteroides sp. A072 TaxID=3461146 RepID=UPI004042F979